MENHVFYKTTVPKTERDDDLLLYFEQQLRSVYRDLYKIRYHNMSMPIVILNDSPDETDTFGTLDLKDLIRELSILRERLLENHTSEIVIEIICIILSSLMEREAVNCSKEVEEQIFSDVHRRILDIMINIRWDELSKQDRKAIEELLKILKSRKTTWIKAGEYIASQNLIVIYYKTIADNTHRDIYAMYTQTLAHEMFHAYHCAVVGEKDFGFTGGRTKEMKRRKTELYEAMADFYSVYYTLRCAEDFKYSEYREVAQARYDMWTEYLLWSWPYAKALYFFVETMGSHRAFTPLPANSFGFNRYYDKFLHVFELVARQDINGAYELLTEK